MRSPEIRLHLVHVFQIAGAKGVPHLAELLKDADVNVRLRVCSTFIAMGESAKKALPALQAALEDPSPQVRYIALGAYMRVGGAPAAIPDLKKIAASDEDGLLRVTALARLATLGGETPAKLVPPLIECLKDADGEVRLQAIYTLHYLGAPAAPALPLLRELAKSDSDPTVRRFADVSGHYIESMMKKQ
jgi:HEAT repeat protein